MCCPLYTNAAVAMETGTINKEKQETFTSYIGPLGVILAYIEYFNSDGTTMN